MATLKVRTLECESPGASITARGYVKVESHIDEACALSTAGEVHCWQLPPYPGS